MRRTFEKNGLCRVFVPYGAVGTGISEESFEAGLKLMPDVIASDAGSTDSGPYYLGTGKAKYSLDSVKEDFERMILAGQKLNIPVLVGSVGTCGTDSGVNWMMDICRDILKEHGIKAKVALIYTSQDGQNLKEKYVEGKITALEGAPDIDEDTFLECANIVGLAGAEPFQQALLYGADIVICGRATDTAIIAALPLLKGCNEAACWHGAKIAECGSLCTSNPAGGGVFLTFDTEGFTVEPSWEDSYCTPYTVSAHMIYENANPFVLREPSGLLDTTDSRYTALDERCVRVTGSKFTHMPYTIKLEGAALKGYQTVTIVGIRDKRILNGPDAWLDHLTRFVDGKIKKYGIDKSQYSVSFKRYGLDAVCPAANPAITPEEIGLVFIVTAKTQELATRIAKIYNPYLLHFPVNLQEQLPTYALLFSPAEIEKGAAYEFMLHHAVSVNDPMELFRYNMEVVS